MADAPGRKTVTRASIGSASQFGFAGHETFAFRYGWLKKGVDGVREDPQLLSNERAIVSLGVGKNMVQSIRHWGLATQLLSAIDHRSLEVSQIGEFLLEHADPYMEEPASLWLIHWLLVTNPVRAATWHLAFTRYPRPDFSKRQLVDFLSDYCDRHDLKANVSTLSRDVDCFIRTYLPSSSKKEIVEESFSCPLNELGLLRFLRDGDVYQFAIGPKPSLPPEVVGCALFAFMTKHREGRKTVAVSDCLYAEDSPGQVFKLDENSLVEAIEALGALTRGAIEIDDTAGLKQVYRRREIQMMELLQPYYVSQGKR